MKKYSYDYEWDIEYCLPNSKVLINKLNIKDADALQDAEREITSVKLAYAKLHPIEGNFDLKHLQKIHKFLFEDIYSWAGELRSVNIAKGNQFCPALTLKAYATRIFTELQNENLLLNCANVPHRLAYYLSEINVLHPFREGNGRTQRLFIEYLAAHAGFRVDFSDVTPEEMIIASAQSFACDYTMINEMFERITKPLE